MTSSLKGGLVLSRGRRLGEAREGGGGEDPSLPSLERLVISKRVERLQTQSRLLCKAAMQVMGLRSRLLG